MKSERFLEALNYIDSKYIEEARCKTMKKRFNFKPIIAVAACAAFALAAVPLAKHFAGNPVEQTPLNTVESTPPANVTDEGYRVLVGSGYDGVSLDIGEDATDFDGLGETFIDKAKLNTTKNIKIESLVCNGIYQNSTRSDYYGDNTDNYVAEIDDLRVEFSINNETGKLQHFLIMDKNIVIEKELSRDECYAKAYEYMKRFVDDAEKYEITHESERTHKFGYFFIWNRVIDEVKTADRIVVAIRENGEIYSLSLQGIGTLNDFNIANLDTVKTGELINEKAVDVYKKISNITCETEAPILARRADGKYILEYNVSAYVMDENLGRKLKDYRTFYVEIN